MNTEFVRKRQSIFRVQNYSIVGGTGAVKTLVYNETIGVNLGFPWSRRLGRTELRRWMSVFQAHVKSNMLPYTTLTNRVKPNFIPLYSRILHKESVGFHSVSVWFGMYRENLIFLWLFTVLMASVLPNLRCSFSLN